MRLMVASLFVLAAASPPVLSQYDPWTPPRLPPMCTDKTFRDKNQELCDPRSPGQRAADAQKAQVKTYSNPATQFKVDCPLEMPVPLNPTAGPQGFRTVGARTLRAGLMRMKVYDAKLTCEYGVVSDTVPPSNKLLGLSYEYSAAGKQCGPTVFPCEDSRCSLVCDK